MAMKEPKMTGKSAGKEPWAYARPSDEGHTRKASQKSTDQGVVKSPSSKRPDSIFPGDRESPAHQRDSHE